MTKNVESCKKGSHESDIHLWMISTTLFTVATKRKFLIGSLVYLSHYLHLSWVFDKTFKEEKVCFTTDQLIEELSSAVTDPEVCTIERIELVQLVEQITSFVYQMINPANTSIIILASFLTRFACIFHFWRLHTTYLNYL